jgi:hypothetical protein
MIMASMTAVGHIGANSSILCRTHGYAVSNLASHLDRQQSEIGPANPVAADFPSAAGESQPSDTAKRRRACEGYRNLSPMPFRDASE